MGDAKEALDEAEDVPKTVEVDGETLTLRRKITARAIIAGQEGDIRGVFQAVFIPEDVERAIDLLTLFDVMEMVAKGQGVDLSKFSASAGS